MKKIFIIFLGAIAFAACNSKSSTATEATTDSTATTSPTEKIDYPYTIDHPDNWNIGSSSNTLTALTALKAFEDGNMEKSVSQFGDSVHLQFDALDTTLSNDGLKAMFTSLRNGYKSINVKMSDWESVVSKDGKEEWVTMWYKQIWEDNKGNKDSADYIDDIRLKNGKIIRLDEYTRKLHN